MKSIGNPVLRPRQQVEDRLRTAIFDGEIRPGEMLPPEAELARQFGVSRTTLREALRVLASEKLIKKIPGAGGGNLVQSINHHSMGTVISEALRALVGLRSINFDEIARVRQLLEVPAAHLAAQNRTDDHVRVLRHILAQERGAAVDDPAIPALDQEFHATIAEASGNRVLSSFIHALHQETEPIVFLDLSPEVGKTTYRQHKAVVDAIEAGDAAEAQNAMSAHLEYLNEHTIRQTLAES